MGPTTDAAPELTDPLLVLERIDEAFYVIDRQWRFGFVNRRAEAFWGRPRAELLGHSMLELFPKFQGSPSHAAHVRAFSSGEPTTAEVLSTATGAPVEVRLYPAPNGLSVYFRDVTQRRRLEQELKTRDELLSLPELSAGIGVWVQDLTTETMTATPQYFRLLGIEPIDGPVPQDFVRSLRHPDDRERHTQRFREAVDGGADLFEGEYRIVRPSGEVRWIFGRGRVTRDHAGAPWRYSGVDLDITERKQQDEHLQVVMGELVHRTNNLLAVVQGLAQQTARSSRALKDFAPVFTARLQGLGHSNALLAHGEWRGALLDQLLRSQVSPLADEARLELDGPSILLTPKAVQNIGLALHELSTNAIKYGAFALPAGRVRVTWSVAGDRLEIIWKERNGPPVQQPTRKGFGRVVSEQVLSSALGATVEVDFAPDGLQWTMVLPAAEFSRQA